MNRFGISVELKNVPVLDPNFMPMLPFNRAFLKGATKPVAIAVERANGQVAATGKHEGLLRTSQVRRRWLRLTATTSTVW